MIEEFDIKELLKTATEMDATDIHLVVDHPVVLRINGDLVPLDRPPFHPMTLKKIIFNMLDEKQKDDFINNKELDFSYFCLNNYQFRVNAHMEKGNVAANIRIMPKVIKTREQLGLPVALQDLALKRKGLIIVAGPAGSGKTTTLTWMVDVINRKRRCKIITVEDPIEYIHENKESLVIQREVGYDTNSFANALKYCLRQDPDVVVIGEIRDAESIAMALTAAETGHLVLTTLHSSDATETINRILDACPSGKQAQVSAQLSENLEGIIGQILVPSMESKNRILATEVMLATRPVRNLIRTGSLSEVRSQMDSNISSDTYTLETCLSDLVSKELISKETAIEYAKYPDLLRC